MRLIVTDANIIIDLSAGGLLELLFRLPDVELCVPDILYVNELAANYGQLPALGLQVVPMDGPAIAEADALGPKHRQLSVNDCLAFVLARRTNATLLTGDRRLREVAEQAGVEVHGTLWVTEQMLTLELVTIQRVMSAYGQMRADGSRLPEEEVRKQGRRWQEKRE